MKKFENILDLTCNTDLIPSVVALDVMKRIIDWTSTGGSYDDEYVKKQIEYASKFIDK